MAFQVLSALFHCSQAETNPPYLQHNSIQCTEQTLQPVHKQITKASNVLHNPEHVTAEKSNSIIEDAVQKNFLWRAKRTQSLQRSSSSISDITKGEIQWSAMRGTLRPAPMEQVHSPPPQGKSLNCACFLASSMKGIRNEPSGAIGKTPPAKGAMLTAGSKPSVPGQEHAPTAAACREWGGKRAKCMTHIGVKWEEYQNSAISDTGGDLVTAILTYGLMELFYSCSLEFMWADASAL